MDDRVFVDYAAIAQSLASASEVDVAPSKRPAPKAETAARQQAEPKAEPAPPQVTLPVPETIAGRHAGMAPRLRDWGRYRLWVGEVNKSWPTQE
jgi:hypothetical protein